MKHGKISWQGYKEWMATIASGAFIAGPLIAYPLFAVLWLVNKPDANNDGSFTISDLGVGADQANSYVGSGLIDLIGGDSWWRFFEIDRTNPDGFFFYAMCFVGWWLWGAVLVALFTQDDDN